MRLISRMMGKKMRKKRNDNSGSEMNLKLTPRMFERKYEELIKDGLKSTLMRTPLLLMRVSKGRYCFETTSEELTATFYPDYYLIKRYDVKRSKNLKADIRSRLNYFENVWQKDNKKYFEILSKRCAADECAAKHTIENPCPDIITIRMNFFGNGENEVKSQAVPLNRPTLIRRLGGWSRQLGELVFQSLQMKEMNQTKETNI